MTPTEKHYLLFLSPRTPRPKNAERPSAKALKNMEAMGWIQFSRARKFDPHDCIITTHGECALDAEESKREVGKSTIVWRPLASMPEGWECLVTDGDMVRVGLIVDGINDAIMVRGMATSRSHWLMWAPMPRPPVVPA
jgi:hypothetical protein